MVLVKLGQSSNNYVSKDSAGRYYLQLVDKKTANLLYTFVLQMLLCSCCLSTAATVAATPWRPVPRTALEVAAPAVKEPWEHYAHHQHHENNTDMDMDIVRTSKTTCHLWWLTATNDSIQQKIEKTKTKTKKKKKKKWKWKCECFYHGHVFSHHIWTHSTYLRFGSGLGSHSLHELGWWSDHRPVAQIWVQKVWESSWIESD